jgi:hypothetical protein
VFTLPPDFAMVPDAIDPEDNTLWEAVNDEAV